MTEKTKGDTRTIETSIEIDAPVDAVWKALTDAGELENWFPMQARVKPGVGGSIWMSWRGEYEGECDIEAWEPERHLRTTFLRPPDDPAAPEIAVDYYLEGQGGKTVLRLVHSGFPTDDSWDEWFDGTRRGWAFELRGMKHYLERHRGTRRDIVCVRGTIRGGDEEAWSLIVGLDGLGRKGALEDLAAGERFSAEAATGDVYEGTVQIYAPPRDLAVVVDSLNGALLRIRVDRRCLASGAADPDARIVHFWLSTYGLPDGEAAAIERRWQDRFAELFPGK